MKNLTMLITITLALMLTTCIAQPRQLPAQPPSRPTASEDKSELIPSGFIEQLRQVNKTLDRMHRTYQNMTSEQNQQKFIDFWVLIGKVLARQIILLVFIVVLLGLLILYLYMICGRGHPRPPVRGAHPINEIYIESDHNSSTNLQGIISDNRQLSI